MKNKIIAAILLLGTLLLGALGAAAELCLLPEAWEKLAPLMFVASGALLLIFAWRCWPNLMAWAFKQENRESMK